MVHVFPGISTTLSFPKSPTQLKQDEKYEDDRAKEKCLLEFPAISLRSFAKFSKNWKKLKLIQKYWKDSEMFSNVVKYLL